MPGMWARRGGRPFKAVSRPSRARRREAGGHAEPEVTVRATAGTGAAVIGRRGFGQGVGHALAMPTTRADCAAGSRCGAPDASCGSLAAGPARPVRHRIVLAVWSCILCHPSCLCTATSIFFFDNVHLLCADEKDDSCGDRFVRPAFLAARLSAAGPAKISPAGEPQPAAAGDGPA